MRDGEEKIPACHITDSDIIVQISPKVQFTTPLCLRVSFAKKDNPYVVTRSSLLCYDFSLKSTFLMTGVGKLMCI